MKASLCRYGMLPSLVNRTLRSELEFPGNPNRASRRRMRHAARGHGRFIDGRLITWSKHNQRENVAEQWRRAALACAQA